MPNTMKPSQEFYSEVEAAEALNMSVTRLYMLLDEHVFNDGTDWYISGTAAVNAAKICAERIKVRAAMIRNRNSNVQTFESSQVTLANRFAIFPDGEKIPFTEIALDGPGHGLSPLLRRRLPAADSG